MLSNRSLELSVAKLFEQGREPGARLEAVPDEVVAGDQRRRIDRAGRLELEVAAAVVDLLALAERGQRVGLMQGRGARRLRDGRGFA